MTTQFETLVAEEQIAVEPEGTAETSRSARWPRARIAGMVLGSITVSLAATALATRLFRGRQQPRARGRRRTRAIRIQPRVAIFAPTITVSLPFSAIAGKAAPSRNRLNRNRAGRARRFPQPRRLMRRFGRGIGRQMNIRRAMLSRSTLRPRRLFR